MSNHIKNIAIVGGGGQIGTWIVSALLSKGTFNITTLQREGSPNKPAEGVHITQISYDDPSTIVEALKGQDVLIVSMSVHAPPDQPTKLIEAAAKAGVPWIVPDEFGAGQDNEQLMKDTLIGVKKDAERKLIEKLGVSSWLSITCGFWYEYSLSGPGLYGIDIAKKEVVFFDDGRQRLNTSTWPQVGRAAANLLSLPIEPEDGKSVALSSYRNKHVHISSFTVNQHEMFDSVKRVTGTTDADWKISSVPAKQRFAEAQKKMSEGDRSAFAYLLYSRMFFPGEDACLYEARYELDNEKLGLPKEDIDEFTKKAVKMSEENYFGKLFGTA